MSQTITQPQSQNGSNVAHRIGRIHVTVGPMKSGKTTWLFKEYTRHTNIGMKGILINHSIDITRFTNTPTSVFNYDGQSVPCIYIDELTKLDPNMLDTFDMIFINEGQFFGLINKKPSELRDFCLYWSQEKGKEVYVSGLDGDYKRKPFGYVGELCPIACEFNKISALCGMCGNGTEASFTWYTGASFEGNVKVGASEYIPLCEKHYYEMAGGFAKQ